MKNTVITSSVIALVVGAAAGLAHARPNFPETEGNNTRVAANVLTLSSGDTISGTVSSSTDPDYFRVLAPVNAVKTIYLHSLAITSGGSGNSFTTRGLAVQSSGASYATTAGSDNQMLSGRITGDVIKWYEFGNGGGIDIRAGRTTTGSAAYSLTHSVTTVSVPSVAVLPGSFNIQTKYSGDGEIFLYDSSFNLIAQNDNRFAPGIGAAAYSTSGLSAEIQNFSLVAGQTYYVAIGHGNTATSVTGSADVNSPFYDNIDVSSVNLRPSVLDVAGTLHRPGNAATSTAAGNADYSLWLNGQLAIAQAGTIAGQEVGWYAINVIPTPGAASVLALGALAMVRRRRA